MRQACIGAGAAVVHAALFAGSAMAARPQGQGRLMTSERPAAAWAIGALFIAGCLVVAFKNSKRSSHAE